MSSGTRYQIVWLLYLRATLSSLTLPVLGSKFLVDVVHSDPLRSFSRFFMPIPSIWVLPFDNTPGRFFSEAYPWVEWSHFPAPLFPSMYHSAYLIVGAQ